jgi:large subunit ribosomal protein L17
MRHLKRTAKLGRKGEHRNLMLANLVCSLIMHRRVVTTLAKAKAAQPVAEKMVTLGKSGTLHDRRLAAARLHQENVVRILFNDIVPTQKERHGGYTRIVKLAPRRRGDAGEQAILEWVDVPVPKAPAAKPETEAKKEPAEPKEPAEKKEAPAATESTEAAPQA